MMGAHPTIVQQDAFNTAAELGICLVTQVRQSLDLTQQQLGDLIGLHPRNVSKAENDDYLVTPGVQHKLLILREVSHIPGIRDLLQFLLREHGAAHAFHAAYSLHLVVS